MKGFLIAVLAVVVFLPSRPAFAGEKNLYVLGGLTLSNLGGDAETFGNALASELETSAGGTWDSNKNTRNGFDVGAGFSYSKKGLWGGALEVHYVERGSNWALTETSGSGLKVDTGMKLAYVEIPALVQITSDSGAKTRPMFIVGPVLGIRSSSKFEVSGAGAAGSQDISSGMKSTYWGLVFGGGLKMRLAPTSALLLQARYQLGLSNLVDSPTFNIKPQDLSFHLGYSRTL